MTKTFFFSPELLFGIRNNIAKNHIVAINSETSDEALKTLQGSTVLDNKEYGIITIVIPKGQTIENFVGNIS